MLRREASFHRRFIASSILHYDRRPFYYLCRLWKPLCNPENPPGKQVERKEALATPLFTFASEQLRLTVKGRFYD